MHNDSKIFTPVMGGNILQHIPEVYAQRLLHILHLNSDYQVLETHVFDTIYISLTIKF